MSINLDTGLWQCFRTKEHGNFVNLVAEVECITYDTANVKIRKKIFDFTGEWLFDEDMPLTPEAPSIGTISVNDELKNFKLLSSTSLKSSSLSEKMAWKFIRDRKLTSQRFYLGVSGKYLNRIIIPYEHNNTLFYFQARRLYSQGMKYLNPKAQDYGVKSSDVLLPFKSSEKYVIVTEGPLDALSLKESGMNATSLQGSILSKAQLNELKGMRIILAFDNDAAGRHGMEKARQLIRNKNLEAPYICPPPKKYNDWNDFLVDTSPLEMLKHVKETVKKYDFSYELNELLN